MMRCIRYGLSDSIDHFSGLDESQTRSIRLLHSQKNGVKRKLFQFVSGASPNVFELLRKNW
jgi:hypothetical protein